MRIRVKTFWPAIAAIVIATILFCLPGEELPKEDWFDLVKVDKWVHVGLFAVLVAAWSLPFIDRVVNSKALHQIFVWIAVSFVGYGLLIEILQGTLIPNRDFDLFDLLADAIGCAVGWWFSRWQRTLQHDH